MRAGIYLIVNKAKGKVQVGSSSSLSRRKVVHWGQLRKGSHSNPHLQRAWNSDGEGAFTYEIVQYCDEEDLLYWEDWWMGLLQSRDPRKGYNLKTATRGVPGEETREKMAAARRGRVHSPETRQKMSVAQTGRESPMKGRELSQESRARIAMANRGKTLSPETRTKLSEAAKRRPPQTRAPLSPETKAKISETKRASKEKRERERCPLQNTLSNIP